MLSGPAYADKYLDEYQKINRHRDEKYRKGEDLKAQMEEEGSLPLNPLEQAPATVLSAPEAPKIQYNPNNAQGVPASPSMGNNLPLDSSPPPSMSLQEAAKMGRKLMDENPPPTTRK